MHAMGRATSGWHATGSLRQWGYSATPSRSLARISSGRRWSPGFSGIGCGTSTTRGQDAPGWPLVTAVFRPFWHARDTDADICDEASSRLWRGGQPGRGEAVPSTPWPGRRPDLAGLPVPGSADGALRTAARRRGRRALAAAGEQVARIRHPPDAGWAALARGSMVCTSERISKW